MTANDAKTALLDFVAKGPSHLFLDDAVDSLLKCAMYIRECEDSGIPVDRNKLPPFLVSNT